MSTRFLGSVLIVLAAAAVAASLLADLLGSGPRGLQAAQILAVEGGVVIALAGAWLRFGLSDQPVGARKRLLGLVQRVADLPNIAWVLLGFAIIYLLFVAHPMFLASAVRMEYFTRYLPDRSPIGNDLLVMTDLIRGWLVEGQSPYLEQFYAPFPYVFFAPLLLLGHAAAYRLVTLLTLLGFAASMLLARAMSAGRQAALWLLFLVTGLFSYGLQFELERGQFNVIAMACCLLSIHLFHAQPRLRFAAYLLFTMAVQLKVYPVVFILMFVKDWREWKSNARRIGGLAILNLAFLFVGGTRMFQDFLAAVTQQLVSPTMNFWNGNHSIKAFVFGLTEYGYGLIPPAQREAWIRSAGLIEVVLLGLLVACLLAAVLHARRRAENGPDPYLLLACTMAALMVPISNDYKLSILAAPLALALSALPRIRDLKHRALPALLLLTVSSAYAALLIPFKYKPFFLGNSYPLLLIILLGITALSFQRRAA